MWPTTAKKWVQSISEVGRSRSWLRQVREFQPRLLIERESDNFVVRTARHGVDLLKALELRHDIFVKQWQGRSAFHGLDVDRFDFLGDHLLIIEKDTSDVVGTYRLICSRFADEFYTSQEFDIDSFVRTSFVKLELGRACVHPRFREGAAIDMLWKGLSEYATKANAQYLFGCSSVQTSDLDLAKRVGATIRASGAQLESFSISPTKPYRWSGFATSGALPLTTLEQRRILPALVRSYLRCGAKMHFEPAFDRDFGCIDFFTLLEWQQLNQRFKNRFA